MSADPISAGGLVGKAVDLVGKPLFSFVRQEIAKRGAGDLAASNPASLDAELGAAIDVLLGDAETAFGQLKVWLKGAISAPPEILTDEEGRAWLGRGDVQAVLKQAAVALITDHPLNQFQEQAKALYSDTSGEGDWYGEPLFTHAVSFLALSITAEIDTGAKAVLVAQTVHAQKSSAEHAALATQIDRLTDIVTAQGMQGQLPIDAVDSFVLAEVQRRSRTRSISKPGKLDALKKLGEQALHGNLQAASRPAKAGLFRFLAAELARDGKLDDARTWLDRAIDVGADDIAVDEARLAILRGEPGTAIGLLEGRADRLANSLRIDVLRKSKSLADAIAFFEEFGSAANMAGHALPALAQGYFEIGRGPDGEQLLAQATPEQLFENPLLLFQRARARLALMASSNALELFNHSVMLPSPTTLRDDAEGRRLRAQALNDLKTLEMILVELEEFDFLETIEPLKLYLRLLSDDDAERETARGELQAKLADPSEALVFAGLAQIFGVPFDASAMLTQLSRARRLRAWTDTELHTAFQLQIRERDPAALVAFIGDNRVRLEALEPVFSAGVEVEALVMLGKRDEARARLGEVADRLPPEDRALLGDLVAAQGEPMLDRHLARFEASGNERDLDLLVHAMIEAKDPRTGAYAERLWRVRRRQDDAQAAANAYAYFSQDEELAALLDALGDEAKSVPALEAHRAWLLYRQGDMFGARRVLAPLKSAAPDDHNLRQLEINIALELGEWHRLAELIQADLDQVDARSPQQLLQAAAFAHFARHSQVMTLVRAAVAKAPDDPAVLMHAWDLALREGQDVSPEASEWMARAIKQSGDSGMFRKVKLEDVIALRDENIAQAKELDSLIMTGQVTVGMAAKPLGTNVTELILNRIWSNSELADPRARLFLPFYAGKRAGLDLAGVDAIALDLPSIMLLQMTGLLDAVFEAFPKIVLPSGTLPALFEHMRHAERGQPSRSKRAALIQHLIEARRIAVLPAGDEGADEVDLLWAAAEERDGIIVHAPPLYQPGTFLEQERDPAPFAARLTSPRAIAEALLARPSEQETADGPNIGDRARFQQFGERWPDEPDEPGESLSRPLMIDGTALFGFADADLLESLLDLGGQISVSPDVLAICSRERDEEEERKALLGRIEALRQLLSNALFQGKAEIGPAPTRKVDHDEELAFDPLMALLNRPGDVETIVSDERVVNHYLQATDSQGVTRPVATSLDVIDALLARKVIAGYAHEQARTRLRQSGVGLIPLRAAEFLAAARRSDWSSGPGPELKAIRDSILTPFFRRGVQLPDERDWVTFTLYALSHAVRDVFRTLDSVEDARKAADFALACVPDVRAYVGEDAPPELRRWASEVLVAFHGLTLNAPDMPLDRLKPFHDWYEQSLYALLGGRDRDLLPAVTLQLKGFVIEDYGDLLEWKAGNDVPTREDIALFMFRRVPGPLADALLQDEEVRAAIGATAIAPLTVAGHRINRTDLFAFLRAAFSDAPIDLVDAEASVLAAVAEKHEDGTLRVTIGSHQVRFEHSALFSSEAPARGRAMRNLLGERTLGLAAEQHWLERAAAGALADDAFLQVSQAAQETPQAFHEEMLEQLPGPDFAMVDLVPAAEDYFANLVPEGATQAALFESFGAGEKLRVARVDALIAAGPLAVSPAFSAAHLAKGLARPDQLRCCEGLMAAGDLYSLLAAFQIVCAGIKSPKLRQLGDRLVELVWKDKGSLDARATDFHSGVILTSAALLERGMLRDWPLHRRRLAVFAHAGHITRALGQFEVEREALLQSALQALGPYHQLGGALDQLSARGWEPGLLNAQAVKAHLLKRFAQVTADLPEDHRPDAWLSLMGERLGDFTEAGDKLLLSLPGPLDEFAAQQPLPVMSSDDYAALLTSLGEADPVPAVNIAYVYPMSAQPPADADVAALEEVLTAKLEALSGEDLDQALQITLLLGWRWKLPDLSRRMFDRFARGRDKTTIVLNWAVLAAAAHETREEQLAALEELALAIALSAPAVLQPAPLFRSIDAIASVAPEFGGALARARTAAALAI